MRLKTNSEVVLAIPDLHIPFQHPDAFEFLKAVKKKYRPTQIVCLGDEIDSYAISDYNSDPDALSPGDEYDKSITKLKELYKIFPEALVCTSNHTARPFKKAVKAGIPARFLKSYRELLQAPSGWNWAFKWEVGGIRYDHGENYPSGHTAPKLSCDVNRRSTVFGHLHSFGGITYVANDTEMLFGMNCGCLIDMETYAFHYSKKFRYKPTLGCGVVVRGVPHFIPMVINKHNRWSGEVA